MLIIVNPYATTVSDRLKNLVVYALRGSYEVDAIDTEARDHATELTRDAAREGYDVVVAFGGDGTVNEAANGLAGSDTPLSCLPGGRANVYCRMLGIPADVVDATEHLLRIADDWRPRRVDLGDVNGRKFTFSAGVGLDASVVERVDAHPRLKARLGEWYYTVTGINTFTRRYLVHPPRLEAMLGDERVAGRQRDHPERRSIHVLRQPARRDGGGRIARRAATWPAWCWSVRGPRTSPRSSGARSPSAPASPSHRHVHPFSGVPELTLRSLDDRPLPLQVDGDYIGEVSEATFGVTPRGHHGRLLRACLAVLIAGLALVLPSATVARLLAAHIRSPAHRPARCSRPTTRGTSASTRCRSPGTPRR